MADKRKAGGRPVTGRDTSGNPIASSKGYPQLTVRIPPALKVEIDLLAVLEHRTQAAVIEAAVGAYVATLPSSTRKTLDGLRAIRGGSEKR